MNFNTLQYFQVLEENDMDYDRNAKLLSLSNSKNGWFTLCYASLDKVFDNKVYFQSNNIKAFHHALLHHCGYRDKDYLMQKIQKINTERE